VLSAVYKVRITLGNNNYPTYGMTRFRLFNEGNNYVIPKVTMVFDLEVPNRKTWLFEILAETDQAQETFHEIIERYLNNFFF
jgi:hypothetical protein